MSRQRYEDTRSAGSSKEVPFIAGETAGQRHDRRGKRAKEDYASAAVLLEGHGWNVRLVDYGSHWIITRDRSVVEWWPSTAKCVINKKWKSGIHVHDTLQLIKVIERRFK